MLCAALLVPTAVRAAEVTEVADAMDERHALEVDFDVTYRHLRRDTKITRENFQNDAAGKPGIVLVDELQHSQTSDELGFRLAVGLWHDLEVHILAPLSLRDQQSWDFATVNGQSVAGTSTLANNKLDVSGCIAPGSCTIVKPIMPIPGGSTRGGFRDPTIGIAWGPINEERELRLHPELFPPGRPVSTWVIGFDYTMPLPGDVDDPSKFGFNASRPRGKVLRKAHVFSLWTAFSKRFTVANPYVIFRATAPVAVKGSMPGDGAFDNCWHPEALSEVSSNCADAAWKGNTGYQPPYEGGFTVGTELVFFEDAQTRRKFAVDLHGDIRYRGPGREYTQVSDALGKLTYADEYVTGTASLSLYGRAASWLRLRAAGTLALDSAHILTAEPIGKDLNGDGVVSLSTGSGKWPEQSPVYDFRLDQVGRRLRAEAAVTWGVSGTLAVSF